MIFTRAIYANGPAVELHTLQCNMPVQDKLAMLTKDRQTLFSDVWMKLFNNKPGLTFSNMVNIY